MATFDFSFPLAVHIADGVLSGPWITGGFGLAFILAIFGAWRLRDEEIPTLALLTAAFFVASLMRASLGVTSVHLLLNGLLGVLLGRRVALAVPLGLFLQAALLGHGGFTTLGINSCVMVLPALVAWILFAGSKRVQWILKPNFRGGLVALSALGWILSLIYGTVILFKTNPLELPPLFHAVSLGGALVSVGLAVMTERRLETSPEFPLGLLIGEIAVLATVFLNAVVLILGGQEDWRSLVVLLFLAHLPIAVVEGIVLGFTVGFLARVKPTMLGWSVIPEETACSADPLP